MSQPDTESYTAAKGGISALTHVLAVSLAGKVRGMTRQMIYNSDDGWEYRGASED